MKKALCYVLALALVLGFSACGGRPDPVPSPESTPTPAPEPTAAPTPEPTPAPEPEPGQDPLERALAWLRAQKDWNFVGAHLGTYQELYELTHPGADIQILGGGIGAKEVSIEVAGTDAQAFAEAGYFSDRFTIHPKKNGDPCFPQDLPIPREPESDHISDRGLRITMDRAVWPVGTDYLRFTVEKEPGENLEFCLEKYADGTWIRYLWPGASIGNDLGLLRRAGTYYMNTQLLPRLGEGLYRIFVSPEGDWAEFVVRADAEPLALEPLVRRSWPEAALLLAGLPEHVETDLRGTVWPAMSHTWQVMEDQSLTDEALAELLLGTGAEVDPSGEVWRAGELTLSTGEEIRVEDDSLLTRALRLTLPLRDPETRDPRELPSLEEAGWTYVGIDSNVYGLSRLFPRTGFRCYSPDIGVLNARLEAALETLGPEDPRHAELADFRFTQEDAKKLFLALLPIQTRAAEYMLTEISLVSPWGAMDEAAAWCVYRKDKGILLLEARYPDHRLEPENAWETLSPEEQIEKFLPLMEGEEEGLRLTRMDYVLIPGNEEGIFQPAWRLLAETASGEVRTWVASTRNDRQSAYDLQRRAYLLELQKPNGIRHIFQSFREEYPDMDVWEDSWGIDLLEDGRDYLVVLCHGADIPALEASGFLPDGVVLDWIESPFNQKESHPCPHEPEWEKDWGTVRLAMGQAEYPPYPGSVELTVGLEKTFRLQPLVCKKYMDGEWRTVCRVDLDQPLREEGETTLQAAPLARLGPGLYRLYLNDKFWVEFKITDRTAEN